MKFVERRKGRLGRHERDEVDEILQPGRIGKINMST